METYINNDAYDSGFESGLRGEPETANPYIPGSDSEDWFTGWEEATSPYPPS